MFLEHVVHCGDLDGGSYHVCRCFGVAKRCAACDEVDLRNNLSETRKRWNNASDLRLRP